MTPSEKFVANLCKNAFLSFWSLPSPLGKKGKELCDLLVVCDPDIIIFSVKEIVPTDSGNFAVDMERWHRKAVEESVKQIYGAQRIIEMKDEVTLSDGITTIKLPLKTKRNIHRVAVAFGSQNKFPLQYGDYGNGFIHVLDERAIQILLSELDTISDFVDYLKASEDFFKRDIHLQAAGPEDLLALYFQTGFDFPKEVDLINIDPDMWPDYTKSEEYLQEKVLNRGSYLWDHIIEVFSKCYNDKTLLQSVSREDLEEAVRQMNRETRFSRRKFSEMLRTVWGDDTNKSKIKARLAKTDLSESQTYVFFKRSNDREASRNELELRCFVARSLFKDCPSVIGIAGSPYEKGKGYAFDLFHLHIEAWEKEDDAISQRIQNEHGYFKGFNTMSKDKS